MFTGLVEATGRIARIEASGPDRRVRVEPEPAVLEGLCEGDSISVSGACLTAVKPDDSGFWTDVSAETLACTTLGDRQVGDRVNLERALLPNTRLGGHLVAGHVDGVGEVTARQAEGRSWRFRVRVPEELARYIAPKGSICIDGISLTVNEVEGAEFGVNIIPHTMAVTTLGDAAAGTRVNIEVDVIARYVERLLTGGAGQERGVSRALLQRAGFAGEDD
jgi:riboflavin synthase